MSASRTASSLGARLEAARERAFVGREAALELFRQGLEAEEAPFAVLFVHGPGGVGKSTLLGRFLAEARAAGWEVCRIDGHSIAPAHTAVLGALGVERLEMLAERVGPGAARRSVIAIDTYETLESLDDWVRDKLAPALPAGAILVLAGRDPPRAAWRADPGWASLLATVALDNLSEEESARLLGARGVPRERWAAIHELTYGHPLALALVADLGRGGDALLPALPLDVVDALLQSLLRSVPTERHRDALELAALARHVDRPLLAEACEDEDGALYEWLRGLSFVDATAEGLYVHDIVRDAVLVHARARDAEALREKRALLSRRTAKRVLEATRETRERAALDVLHLMRTDPKMRPYYDWQERLGGGSRPMRDEELPLLLELASEHEGEAAARIARDLHERHPEAFIALTSAAGDLRGFLVYLRLSADALAVEARRVPSDPVLCEVERVVEASGPLRPGEHAGLLRFWLWRDAYQDPGAPTHVPHSKHLIIEWCSARGLGPALAVVQRAKSWAPFLGAIGFAVTGRPIELDGREFRLFLNDFRRVPPALWISSSKGAVSLGPHRVLSRSEFESAVRAALRGASRPAELLENPLLETRLAAEHAGSERPTPSTLRSLLELAVSSLSDERDDRTRRVLELTYLKPAPTQEAAAERLGLAFSTYRRVLGRGVEAVTALLWQREIGRG